jgi:hypothetical protein
LAAIITVIEESSASIGNSAAHARNFVIMIAAGTAAGTMAAARGSLSNAATTTTATE